MFVTMRNFLLFLLLLFCTVPQYCSAQDNYLLAPAYNTIRIGLLRTDNNVYQPIRNNLDLYLKGRLGEIGQTNHWKYEFTDVDPDEALEKLNGGELDFVFPEIPETFEDDNYLFSERGLGFSILSLYARRDDYSNSIYSAVVMDTKTLGYISNEWSDPLVDFYLKQNRWKTRVVKYSDGRKMMEDLKVGILDLIIADGTRQNDPFVKVIDRVNLLEDSIMTSKNNGLLIEALNTAIFSSEINMPDFESWLKAEYLEPVLRDICRFNEEELRFIKTSKPLKVVFPKEMKPLVFLDQDGQIDGLYPQIIGLLGEYSGLKFEMLLCDSYEEARAMLNDGRANLVFDLMTNANFGEDRIYRTSLAHKEIFVAVAKRGQAVPSHPKVAVFELFSGMDDFIRYRKRDWKITTYPTIKQCLEAVSAGEADFAALPKVMIYNSSVLTFYPNLDEIQGQVAYVPLSLSIYHEQAKIIRNIIDVASVKLDDKYIIQKSIAFSKPDINFAFLLSKYAIPVIAIVTIILMMTGFIVIFMIRNSIHKRQSCILKQKNTELETALKTAERLRISRDSYRVRVETDGLTGLFNKVALETYARERDNLRSSYAETHDDAIIMIDVDHFKEINDTYGHKKGDELLVAVAKILLMVFRNTDRVGRFGGDEFVILMQDVQDNTPYDRIIGEIRQRIRGVLRDSGVENLTLSIGIALSHKDGRDYDEVFAAADKALYEVKVQGRDGYCIAGGPVIH